VVNGTGGSSLNQSITQAVKADYFQWLIVIYKVKSIHGIKN
jgi:hypothetical protein